MPDVDDSGRSDPREPVSFPNQAVRDLARARPLAWLLFRSNLRTRHRRARLGYLWLLVPALATATVSTVLRSHAIVAMPHTALPYPVFVLSGMILWQLFLESLNAPLQQLSANRHIISRSPVPHEAILLAGVYEVALNAGVRVVVLAAALLLWRVPVGWTLPLVLPGMAAIAMLGLAAGLVLAPVGLLYDDVGRVLSLVATFGLFLSPVIYPFPPGSFLWLNPVAPMIATTRGWISGPTPCAAFGAVSAASAMGLIGAWRLYRIARWHVVDRIG